jgi:hypothetical protein
MASLPHFPKFTVHEQNAGIRWRSWLERFEIFLTAMNVTGDARKRAMLLHYSGDQCFEVFDGFTAEQRGDTYADLKKVIHRVLHAKAEHDL